MSIGSLVRVYC